VNQVGSIYKKMYACNTLIFYYTPQHVSAIQISHHQVDVG